VPTTAASSRFVSRSSFIEELEKLAKESPESAVLYAYLTSSTRLTTWDVVVALVRQLVESTTRKSDLERVEIVFKEAQSRNRRTRPTLSEIASLLKRLLKDTHQHFLVIDGLNEIQPKQQAEILEVILPLDAKLLIMSGDPTMITSHLERQTPPSPVFMHTVTSSVDPDSFITHTIEKIPSLAILLRENGIIHDVMNKIKLKTDGM